MKVKRFEQFNENSSQKKYVMVDDEGDVRVGGTIEKIKAHLLELATDNNWPKTIIDELESINTERELDAFVYEYLDASIQTVEI
jgi:hypothetical protein